MKKCSLDMVVSANILLGNNHFLLKFTYKEKLPEMLPGQFVQVRIDNAPGVFLRRPISINFVDKQNNELWLLIQKVGEGTRKMSEYKTGDVVNMLLPLGNSFTMPQNTQSRLLLVGGGVGIAPLLYMGSLLKQQGCNPMFLLGARSVDGLMQIDDFKQFGDVFITTEDGSAGEKGFVTQHSILHQHIDKIYTCGPTPMMQAVARFAQNNDIECEASLENKMACGFGACLCCVTQTQSGHKCVCTEGPVFNTKELSWQI
jgi:2-polyprenylphenol hydroxylase and related flavodoxin oxidoreductases